MDRERWLAALGRIQASAGTADSGRRVRVSRAVRGSRRDAERALTTLLREIDQGTVALTGAETFAAYLERWLQHMRGRVGATTWARYEGLARLQLIPRCGGVKLAALRPHHLQAALDDMRESGASAASTVKAHRVASQALGQAVRWQLLQVNPAAAVSPPREGRRELRIPTPAGATRLLRGSRGTLHGRAGPRGHDRDAAVRDPPAPMERRRRRGCSRAGWEDPAGATGDLDPTGDDRRARRHRAEQAERRLVCGETWTDSGLVVDRGDGQAVHPDVMTRAFERAAERAKLHGVRLHDLRHSFASVLLMPASR